MFRIAKYFVGVLLVVGLGILLVHGHALGVVKLRGKLGVEPVNLDPAALPYTEDKIIANQVFQGLVTFDISAEAPFPISPVLAESYEISKDAKMITFKLHKGVQFHHGYGELTSEDVVFSLQRHLDPKVASRARAQFNDVERIEAPDKHTVRIYMKVPSALSLMRNLSWQNAGFIVSKSAVTKLGDKFSRMPIGTGPYYFDRWEPGEKIVLKKFDKYWRTPARIDELEFWIIAEEMVALGALEKGDLDFVTVSQLGSYTRAKAIKGIYLAEANGSAWQFPLWINHKMKPMDDLRVRRALAHALDIEGICKRIGPLVAPFPSPLSSVVFAATDEFWRYEYDLKKAKRLLAEAGYPKGFELRMIYNRAFLYEPIGLEVKRCWDKIVDVKLELVERGVFYKTVHKFNQHVAVWGFSRFSPFLYAQGYLSGPKNHMQYSNPEVDKVVMKAKTATTEEESRKYWREFQRIVAEDVGIYIPAVSKSIVAIKDNVKGVLVSPLIGVVILDNAYVE